MGYISDGLTVPILNRLFVSYKRLTYIISFVFYCTIHSDIYKRVVCRLKINKQPLVTVTIGF